MSYFFFWRGFFLGFGRNNPEANGPAGTRTYFTGGNRVEYHHGKRQIRYEREFHHTSCPCFKCEFKRPYDQQKQFRDEIAPFVRELP